METEQVLKPSFMQRTRNALKKKWVNVAGGVLLASALTMGAAPKAIGQEVIPAARPALNYDKVQPNATFVGTTAGDHDLSRNLDFVLNNTGIENKYKDDFKLWVHEDYDWTNKDVLSEVKKRINNPDQYPWIEAVGKYWPMNPNGRFDGRLDLEAIITTDLEGNEEIFYTDPADSNMYYLDDNYFTDWAFFPGRHLTGFHYPYFGGGGHGPSWDWDGDGIPNRFDMFPFSWDPWDPWMCDPWYGSLGWFDFGWSPWGWNWGWDNHFGHNWMYWGYWGGPGHYTDIDIITDHHGNNVHWRDHMSRITKDQLRDPNYIGDANGIMRQLTANREAHRLVLDNNQLQQRKEFVKSIDKANYEVLKRNPQIRTRDSNGKDRIIRVNPSDYKPDPNTGRINSERIMRRGDEGNYSPTNRGTIRDPGSREIRERNPPPSPPPSTGSTGTIKKVEEKKESSPEIKEKEKDDAGRGYSLSRDRAYSPSSSRSSANAYQQRSTTTYQPRVKQDDLTSRIREVTPRIIRPTQQEVKKYSSPIIRENNYRPNTPSRSIYTQPRITWQPRSSIGRSYNYSPSRSYSAPTIRSSPPRSKSSSKSSISRSYSGSKSYKPSSSHSSSSGHVRKK
jgi:hypothetical protein